MDRKKLIKIFIIFVLLINLCICLFGIFVKKPIVTYDFNFTKDNTYIDDSESNLFVIIPIILIDILLIFLTIKKLNKTKFIIIIIFLISTFLMPAYEVAGLEMPTMSTEETDSRFEFPPIYLREPSLVYRRYNIYGMKIYEK